MRALKIIDSPPMDTAPDMEYDVERPASRYRRKYFKRRYFRKDRKNDGNNDYVSLLRLGPDDRGCAMVHGMVLVLVGLVLILTIQPIMNTDLNKNTTLSVTNVTNDKFSALNSLSNTTDEQNKENNRPSIHKPGSDKHLDDDGGGKKQIYTEAPTSFKQTYAYGTHDREGPNEGGSITTLQRRCSTGYQTPHERSQATLKNYEIALAAGFGNCGPYGEKHTSLSETVKHFSSIYPTYGSSGDGWMWLAPAKKAVGVRHVRVPFHAISVDGRRRTQGGDEFVLTFLGWTKPSEFLNNESVVVKTAVIAQDRGNGKYDAFLAIPDVPFEKITLTLSHYYGCYQGFFLNKYHDRSEYLNLEVGPKLVSEHMEFDKLVLAKERDEDYGWWNEDLPEKVERKEVDRRWLTVPECEASQIGMDALTNGIWADRVKGDGEIIMSTDSVWLPLCCLNPSSHSSSTLKQIRIGDSTMPNPTLNTGDVYDTLQPSHKEWVDYLVQLHHKRHIEKKADASREGPLVLSTGLQYVLSRHNPETAAELVTRMLCQITLFYPGKVLLIGAIPIQEELDIKSDVTDQNVRHLDAILRQKVNKAGGFLNNLCEDSEVEKLYEREWRSKNNAQSIHNYQKFNEERKDGDITMDHSKNFMKLNWLLKKMSKLKMQTLWYNRKVVYVDIDSFLRSQPEISMENEKVQVVEPGKEGRSTLFEGAHEKLFMNIIQMRQAVKDN